MSDRFTEQGLPRTSTGDGSYAVSRAPTTSAPDHDVQRTTAGTGTVISPTSQRQPQSIRRAFELPPLPPSSNLTGGSFSPSTTRIAGVSSILNPSHEEDLLPNRRRKASQLESPISSVQSLPPIVTSAQGLQAAPALPAPSPSFQYAVAVDRQPRRILTPRSPFLHRAASLGQLNPLAGTISAHQIPFPTSPRARAYAIEPGTSGAPPLPTQPAAARPSYGFSAPTPSSEAARRAGTGLTRPRALSSSASPSTSYSSYSQAGQTSPVAQYLPMSMAPLQTPNTTASYDSMSGPGTAGSERQRPVGIPISSSGGQNVYQMMTLETTSGTVQLPVDVQAASRVADEKRRRNAGASARFRQRRKEKEKEASTTIARLEQQVKELGEDADFYRRERDFMAGILIHVPGCESHFPRPTSPRNRRSSITALPSAAGVFGYPSGQEHLPRSPEEDRNVRRRTSTFSLPPPPPLQLQLPASGGGVHPTFGPQSYATPLVPQPHSAPQHAPPGPPPASTMRGPLLAPSQSPAGQLQSQPGSRPPQSLQAMPQTGPWNPYASERRLPGPPGPPNQSRDNR